MMVLSWLCIGKMEVNTGQSKVGSVVFKETFGICFVAPKFMLLIPCFTWWFAGAKIGEEQHGSKLRCWFVGDAKV